MVWSRDRWEGSESFKSGCNSLICGSASFTKIAWQTSCTRSHVLGGTEKEAPFVRGSVTTLRDLSLVIPGEIAMLCLAGAISFAASRPILIYHFIQSL